MRRDRRSGSDVLLLRSIDVEPEVAEVILADVELKNLVDDRQQVIQRPNRLERNSVGRAEETAGCGQDQGVFDGRDRDAAIIKHGRKETIIAADRAGRSRRSSIGVEDLADVILFGDLHDFLARVSALGLPQRGSINANRVAVVAQSTE